MALGIVVLSLIGVPFFAFGCWRVWVLARLPDLASMRRKPELVPHLVWVGDESFSVWLKSIVENAQKPSSESWVEQEEAWFLLRQHLRKGAGALRIGSMASSWIGFFSAMTMYRSAQSTESIRDVSSGALLLATGFAISGLLMMLRSRVVGAAIRFEREGKLLQGRLDTRFSSKDDEFSH